MADSSVESVGGFGSSVGGVCVGLGVTDPDGLAETGGLLTGGAELDTGGDGGTTGLDDEGVADGVVDGVAEGDLRGGGVVPGACEVGDELPGSGEGTFPLGSGALGCGCDSSGLGAVETAGA